MLLVNMLFVDAGNPSNLSARFRVFNYAIILKFKPFTFLQFSNFVESSAYKPSFLYVH